MQKIAAGRQLRMLRIRRAWRQSDVAARADLSPTRIARHERGEFSSIRALERHATVFGVRLDIRLVGRGGELARLTDQEHAAIVEAIAALLRSAGFEVEPEASFSEWGERGRIDLLAFDPRTRTVVIVEAKTQLLDLQDLYGSLNVKERLAVTVARSRGWSVQHRVTVLAVADTAANRAVVRRHASLFAQFATRRLTLRALDGHSERLLSWMSSQAANGGRAWIGGRQRIRASARGGSPPARLAVDRPVSVTG